MNIKQYQAEVNIQFRNNQVYNSDGESSWKVPKQVGGKKRPGVVFDSDDGCQVQHHCTRSGINSPQINENQKTFLEAQET
jgi:hypothetical protein